MHPADRVVVVLRSNVTFTCFYLRQNSGGSTLSIQWLVNSSSFEDFNLTNVVSEFKPNAGIGVLNLFDLSLEYNNTCIQCVVTLSSGHDSASRETMLLLQGNNALNWGAGLIAKIYSHSLGPWKKMVSLTNDIDSACFYQSTL